MKEFIERQHRLVAIQRKALAGAVWPQLVHGTDARELPYVLFRVWPYLSLPWRRFALAHTWTAVDGPGSYMSIEGWVAMFREVGFHSDSPWSLEDPDQWMPFLFDPGSDVMLAEPPTGDLTLWRGGRHAHGMSWTPKRLFADVFRVLRDGRLWTATVPADRVLAYYINRRELEYVIDPRGLEVQEIDIPEGTKVWI